MRNEIDIKRDIEFLKQEMREARQEGVSYGEMEVLYCALEELQIELYKVKENT